MDSARRSDRTSRLVGPGGGLSRPCRHGSIRWFGHVVGYRSAWVWRITGLGSSRPVRSTAIKSCLSRSLYPVGSVFTIAHLLGQAVDFESDDARQSGSSIAKWEVPVEGCVETAFTHPARGHLRQLQGLAPSPMSGTAQTNSHPMGRPTTLNCQPTQRRERLRCSGCGRSRAAFERTMSAAKPTLTRTLSFR